MFASSRRLVESTCRRLLSSFQCSIHRAAIASKVVSLLLLRGRLSRPCAEPSDLHQRPTAAAHRRDAPVPPPAIPRGSFQAPSASLCRRNGTSTATACRRRALLPEKGRPSRPAYTVSLLPSPCVLRYRSAPSFGLSRASGGRFSTSNREDTPKSTPAKPRLSLYGIGRAETTKTIKPACLAGLLVSTLGFYLDCLGRTMMAESGGFEPPIELLIL